MAERKEKCSKCGGWYVDLDNHKACRGKTNSLSKRKAGTKHECPKCGKSFVNLENHRVCHGRGGSGTERTDGTKHECPKCGKSFVNLENHTVCHGRKDSKLPQYAPVCREMNLLQGSPSGSSHSSKESRRDSHSSHGRHRPSRGNTGSRRTAASYDEGASSSSSRSTSYSSSHGKLDTDTIIRLEVFIDDMVTNGIIHHSRNPRTDISSFFREEVKLKQSEIEIAAKHFNQLQQKVVEYLESRTNWRWRAFRAGSHYDGTKVSRPNEMDCVLVPDLCDELEPVYSGCVNGFCKVKVRSPSQDIRRISDGHFINKSKYRKYIFGIMDKFVEDNAGGRTRCQKNMTHSSSPSYGVVYDGVSTDYGSLHVDVDFVPVLKVPSWPPFSFARDLRRLPKNISPSIDVIHIMEQGVNLVTTPCPGSPEDQDLQWKVACSYAEKKLTYFGENTCWKPVLRTMKRVVEIAKGIEGLAITGKSLEIKKAAEYTKAKYFRRSDFRLSFSTYYIRSLMWWLLYELTAGNHVWKDDTKEGRLHYSLDKLRQMITGDIVVPHFFIPGIKDIMTVRRTDREFMYILVRATQIMFSRMRDRRKNPLM